MALRQPVRLSPDAARTWWLAQSARTQIAFAFAMVFAVAGLMNLALSVGRPTTAARIAPSAATLVSPPPLRAEAEPSDPARAWSVVQVWSGAAPAETGPFTVGEHWRVDWLFSPASSGALQVFIYHADGRLLMQLAADTDRAGAGSSFWLGPGRYFLKVNASGGDWKLSVQDLR